MCVWMGVRGCLVHILKNWKYVFENMCGNICGWKSIQNKYNVI